MTPNKFTLIGRLQNDPEIKTGKRNRCDFLVATNRSWLDPYTKSRKSFTELHHVKSYGRLADLCQKYLVKDRQVYVEGVLKTTKSKNITGSMIFRTTLIAENMIFLDKSPDVLADIKN